MRSTHTSKNRRVPDRRGGRNAQARPRQERHCHHIMETSAEDARYAYCSQWGCSYAEYNGRPAAPRTERRVYADADQSISLFGLEATA